MDVHKRIILIARFVFNLWCSLGNKMMTASCTRYCLTTFEPLLHLLSHLDHVFFVNAKDSFNFFLAYFLHRAIVQNLVVEGFRQNSFCSMAFHCTTNSITQWFPVACCKENLFSMEKLSLRQQKLRKFLKILYCPLQPYQKCNRSLWGSGTSASRFSSVVSDSCEQNWCLLCCQLNWNRVNIVGGFHQHLCSRWLGDAMCNTLCSSGSFVSRPVSDTVSSLWSLQHL